jgi:hypothetical protein
MRPSSTASRRLAGIRIPWHVCVSRRVGVGLLSGAMLLLVGCGSESSTMVRATPTPEQCTHIKNPPGRLASTVNNSACANGHCYGVAEWVGAASTLGTTIVTVPLVVANSSNQFIDNEEWLSDNVTAKNWVETGYGTFTGGNLYTFWADNRVLSGGASYYLWVLDPTNSGDNLSYSITSSGSQAFLVAVEGSTCTAMKSTNNPLDTTKAVSDIGLEAYGGNTGGNSFCGMAGMSAPAAAFTNIGLDSSLVNVSYSQIQDATQNVLAAISSSAGVVSSITTSC